MVDPQGSRDIGTFKAELQRAYNRLFVELPSERVIREVHQAMQSGQPFLDTAEKNGSFSTIFSPFHAGQSYPVDVEYGLQTFSVPGPLRQFLERCANIEVRTEQFAWVSDENEVVDKDKIQGLLKEFLENFPSPTVFTGWIDHVSLPR